MKKLIVLIFAVGLVFCAHADLKNKQVAGKWKYEVDTGNETMTGVFNIVEKDRKLTGEVVTDDGYTMPMSKVEIKEGNKLYIEVKTDNDLIKVDVKVEGEKFSGMGSSYDGSAPITGIKVKE